MRSLVLCCGKFATDVAAEPVSTSVMQAAGVDPSAFGYASGCPRTACTRMLPLQLDNGTWCKPMKPMPPAANMRWRATSLYLCLGTAKGGGSNDAAREFLRFVLSEEGQQAARGSGGFAIPGALARLQRTQLDPQ